MRFVILNELGVVAYFRDKREAEKAVVALNR